MPSISDMLKKHATKKAGMASAKTAGTAQASTVVPVEVAATEEEQEVATAAVAKPVKKKAAQLKVAKKTGRPPKGDRAMTNAERQAAWRARQKSQS